MLFRSSTDRWCILYPTIKRLLRADVKEITELSLLDNAREPVRFLESLGTRIRLTSSLQLSRVIFEAAVAWAARSGKSNFWSLARTPARGAPRDASIRTDECVSRSVSHVLC